jgi:tRNA(Phe) wybutosine-synthesizing methylase Tyw3
MENLDAVEGRKVRRVWLVLAAMLVLLAALVVWKSASMAKKMSTVAASNGQDFSQSAMGSQVKFVVEIRERGADGKITGKLLEKKTEEIYARTTTPVTLQSNAQTKVVMGKAADVHSGAVVHVTGTVQKDHSIHAEQIVILTGYVNVQ